MGDGPVSVAVVDDYDVVVAGVARLLAPFPDRALVVELDACEPVTTPVDVVLFDTFGQGEAHAADLDAVLRNDYAEAVAVYTWNTDPALIEIALERGVRGYLSKRLSADDLVDALERIAAGEVVVPAVEDAGDDTAPHPYPGSELGLTRREAEILAFVAEGLTNAEIADRLFISVNSVKTHVRNLYSKLGVHTRGAAVRAGLDLGFRVEHKRVSDWALT